MDLTRPQAPYPYDLLPKVPATFTITSQDMEDGKPLADKFAAPHENISPALAWHGYPKQTQSFVVTCFDPDAPTPSGWWHWAVLAIDAAAPYLAQNVCRSDLFLEGACFHARNDSGTWAYYGPYPPAGDGPHRYIFTVYALDVPTLELDGDTSIAAVAFHALSHTLARAELTVTYEIKA